MAALHKHSVLDVAVNQAVEDIGLVSWICVLEQVSDHPHFVLLYHSSHSWTSNAVSVNDDFLRETIIIILIITHGIIDEALKDICSLYSNYQFLKLSVGFSGALL